ncbi:putative acetyltransferase [Sulfobacillus acidophilus TPY]|uniref:GCN5-related N-acetyltransferase n=1 Tax=Sulfobacillus acidophilus (strain ATCC 700253 / DSM 10332 / NAL) TaxID=679936 RepID=G8TSV0_SULAD|nr:putative acetyltransferase [Sulfobacillus acidophilus TPY]AEW05565.1 GCN5-related N-acetyltransferase [Sulfobacillus acidophilus DSM 10332]
MSWCITPIQASDRPWLRTLWEREWGGLTMVSRGRVHFVDRLPGWIARDRDHRPVGAVTVAQDEKSTEIVSLNALIPRQGIGRQLLLAVETDPEVRRRGRLWLITSNDNLDALAFYLRLGYRLTAIHRDAITRARAQKPSIPLRGHYGIPLWDEWELEKELD